ncbi:MAG: hypothetical protein M1514_03860 [Patescibacteria group bacterium]|nr:hypothetical protein [Patescibacteria group bacterium]
MRIGVITKNKGKIKIVEHVFPKYGIEFEFIDKEYPEIQAATSKEIAEYTVIQASNELEIPVLREDASLYINALGFPGPFTAFFENMAPPEKLLEILKPFKDRSGYFECAISFAEQKKPPVTFVERYDIEINETLAGDQVFVKPYDKILKFKGETRTFAEYPYEERIPIWAKYYEKMAEYIASLK